MKKIFLILPFAIMALSCTVDDGDSASYSSNRIKQESSFLVMRNIEMPLGIFEMLMKCSDYLNSDEEGRADSRYDDIRSDLYECADGHYKISETDFYTNGRPLSQTGGRYVAGAVSWFYGMDVDSLTIECMADDMEWNILTDSTTVLQLVKDKSADTVQYSVRLEGSSKSYDGYDIAFHTVEGFHAIPEGKNYNFYLQGTFFHTVSRGSQVLDVCRAVYRETPDDYSSSDVTVYRP